MICCQYYGHDSQRVNSPVHGLSILVQKGELGEPSLTIYCSTVISNVTGYWLANDGCYLLFTGQCFGTKTLIYHCLFGPFSTWEDDTRAYQPQLLVKSRNMCIEEPRCYLPSEKLHRDCIDYVISRRILTLTTLEHDLWESILFCIEVMGGFRGKSEVGSDCSWAWDFDRSMQ